MDKLTTKPTASSRKRLTHGIKFWLRTGRVNPSIRGYKKIQKYLVDLETQLIEESGGPANLTAAREILVRSTIRGYGVIMLAELYASRYSVVRPDQAKSGVLAFQPILEKGYIGILAQIRANLMALGLDRREVGVVLTPAEMSDAILADLAKKGPESDCKGKTIADGAEPRTDSDDAPGDDDGDVEGDGDGTR